MKQVHMLDNLITEFLRSVEGVYGFSTNLSNFQSIRHNDFIVTTYALSVDFIKLISIQAGDLQLQPSWDWFLIIYLYSDNI